MIKNKRIDAICCIVLAAMLLLTVLFMNGKALGLSSADREIGYESRLFDTSTVHTIDIAMDEEDWDEFLASCTDEEYISANLVIDGKAVKNVGLRAKGNTSLTSVAQYGNNRYSFKIEFDHYDKSKSYYGLDKLCLNNIIQDNTYLKDYLSYTMMAEMGVPSPLCSFVYITVNGEDWGLYLAVEGIEESFLERNYGSDYGNLYKPDSVSIGGNAGKNADDEEPTFDFQGKNPFENDDTSDPLDDLSADTLLSALESAGVSVTVPDTVDQEDTQAVLESILSQTDMTTVLSALQDSETIESGDTNGRQDFTPDFNQERGNAPQNGGDSFGMGSDDVKLQYIDDDPESYSNIFSSAKTDITEDDEDRLIQSLKTLSDYLSGDADEEKLEDVVNIEEVIRYFVVHNFVCNGDSYTGSIIHNYYLYEKDSSMEMIPWDYNLAFGGFGGNGGDMTSTVNSPIDSPVDGTLSDRPMVAWIFENEEYTALYHQIYQEFIDQWFTSGYFEQLLNDTVDLISPYVEKDPTAFCSYEEFQQGVEALRAFCELRAESVSGQLEGTIPSTSESQSADSSALIDASSIDADAMGGQNTTMGGNGMNNRQDNMLPSFPAVNSDDDESSQESNDSDISGKDGTLSNNNPPSGSPPEKPDDERGGPPSAENRNNSDMQAPPDINSSSENDESSQNTQPSSSEDENTPQQSESTSSETDSDNNTPPSPPDQNNGGRPDMPNNSAPVSENTDNSSRITSEEWGILAACAGVLFLGLLVAKLYRKR